MTYAIIGAEFHKVALAMPQVDLELPVEFMQSTELASTLAKLLVRTVTGGVISLISAFSVCCEVNDANDMGYDISQ